MLARAGAACAEVFEFRKQEPKASAMNASLTKSRCASKASINGKRNEFFLEKRTEIIRRASSREVDQTANWGRGKK